VDGQAFNITDGERHNFWDFPRAIWRAAGWKPQDDQPIAKMPSGLAVAIAAVLEWLYCLFTLGTKRPGLLSRQQVEYSCFTHTYNIDKAREKLGYSPVADFEEGIRKAVKWNLDHNGWAARLDEHNPNIRKTQ